ncbi:hypothetical protein ACFS5L_29460 [Streptomyces phyllanthi]|uniref:Uncharacterized protein n=1 Tax=Streptomyces phyllanthi TaxID=1803180 RepID=A0A5N8WA40_9ACTN|nr:hypothetical protein [Streptomyces phyllanthi]MPY42995.1 hypothetical protein [Streptomyces phyllanthi]
MPSRAVDAPLPCRSPGESIAAGTPGSAAAQPLAAGTYCTPWEGHYGAQGWTYADARVCLVVTAAQKVTLRAETDRNTYYWGGAWYNASSNWPASWRADGTVTNAKGYRLTYDIVTLSQKSRSGSTDDVAGGAAMAECGTYSVTVRFRQHGPYWTDSADIDSGTRTHQVDVPCS